MPRTEASHDSKLGSKLHSITDFAPTNPIPVQYNYVEVASDPDLLTLLILLVPSGANRIQEDVEYCTIIALAGQASINVKHSMYGA